MHILRLAYTTQFLIALIAVFTLWSEVGGQGHLDLMPWYANAALGAGAALATVNATAAADRRDALQILALVLKRSQPPQIGAVLAAYQKNTAAQARLSLMEVMGQTSSEQALPVLRDALKDPTAEIRRGAILAMTD